ncbi:hypothetical protein BV22DRAFT_1197245 [Leucogyrophana mollusca]|uniref:Uncharacterized protein n=1 Tax=Leucogyrophana mollusca TaxID=85980 RepID=A0ACB8BAP8_9AGAM|nr:hypothetical protein BV22DRAFT_1197245 [Leucogyrophana mollusca]
MHNCLLITEILQAIFSSLEPTTSRMTSNFGGDHQDLGETRRSLSFLARTCRAFYEPAMDVLYAELGTLDPLVRGLPTDLWDMDATTRFLTFKRRFTNEDFLKLRRNAQRVRILGSVSNLGQKLVWNIDYEAMFAISGFCVGSRSLTLCSGLRELTWDESRLGFSPFLEIFLAPSLTSLRLRGHWPRSFGDFLLHAKCPSLKIFDGSGMVISTTFSTAICHWQQLEHLHTRVLTNQAMHHLASLPSLRHLAIDLDPHIFQYSTVRFPATLESFRLHSVAIPVSAMFLEHLQLSPRQVEIISDLQAPAITMQNLFTALVSHLAPEYLQTLAFSSYQRKVTGHAPPYIFSFQTIAPLLSFSRLQHLELDTFCTSYIDDDALGHMASSWPRLEILRLGVTYIYDAAGAMLPKATPRGLGLVLQRCPNLHDLGLAFDATLVEDSSSMHLGNICNRRIARLHVGNSPLNDPRAVAAFLSSVMPSLLHVVHNQPPPWPSDEFVSRRRLWREVSRLLKLSNSEECAEKTCK